MGAISVVLRLLIALPLIAFCTVCGIALGFKLGFNLVKRYILCSESALAGTLAIIFGMLASIVQPEPPADEEDGDG